MDKDLIEWLRLRINDESFEDVREIFLERDEEIRVAIKKDERRK